MALSTYFRCSPLVLDLARKTTVHTAKIMKATVRAPTPVEPTSSMVPHAVTVSGILKELFVKRHHVLFCIFFSEIGYSARSGTHIV
jgi:hypothetical protein